MAESDSPKQTHYPAFCW